MTKPQFDAISAAGEIASREFAEHGLELSASGQEVATNEESLERELRIVLSYAQHSEWSAGTRVRFGGVAQPLGAGTETRLLERRIRALERQVRQLTAGISRLGDESVVSTELSEIPGLKLKRPIPVVIEESSDEVIARWPEAGVLGLGDSEGEAIDSLRRQIIETLTDLLGFDSDSLSRNAKNMLSTIRHYAETTPEPQSS